MPKVSIVIPSFNSKDYIVETIDSILRQSFRDFEILLIDDCSTDGTEEIIQSISDDRLRYLKLEQNHGGPSRPRNVGIRLAQGTYVAFFDSDDLMLPGKLAKSVSFLDREEDVALVFTDALTLRDGGTLLDGTLLKKYSGMRRCLKETEQTGEYILHSRDAFQCLFFENYIPTSSVIARKDRLNQVGFFDETLLNSDDRDMWFRVTRHNDLGFVDTPLHTYRLRGGSVSKRGILTARNRIQVLEKQIATGLQSDLKTQALRLIARNYYGIGYSFRRQGDLRNARHYYTKSLKHDLSWSALRGFFSTLAGRRVLNWIRPV